MKHIYSPKKVPPSFRYFKARLSPLANPWFLGSVSLLFLIVFGMWQYLASYDIYSETEKENPNAASNYLDQNNNNLASEGFNPNDQINSTTNTSIPELSSKVELQGATDNTGEIQNKDLVSNSENDINELLPNGEDIENSNWQAILNNSPRIKDIIENQPVNPDPINIETNTLYNALTSRIGSNRRLFPSLLPENNQNNLSVNPGINQQVSTFSNLYQAPRQPTPFELAVGQVFSSSTNQPPIITQQPNIPQGITQTQGLNPNSVPTSGVNNQFLGTTNPSTSFVQGIPPNNFIQNQQVISPLQGRNITNVNPTATGAFIQNQFTQPIGGVGTGIVTPPIQNNGIQNFPGTVVTSPVPSYATGGIVTSPSGTNFNTINTQPQFNNGFSTIQPNVINLNTR